MSIESIFDKITEVSSNLFTFSAIEDGVEYTLNGPNRSNPCNNTYSVAKAFTMTAAGMCYDRGLLKIEDKVCDLFRDQLPAEYDPKWEQVTVDAVLRHSMGIAGGFLDIDVENLHEYPTHDFLQIIFSKPLPATPGEDRVYSDAAYYLLSRIVTQVSGEKLEEMLMKNLFLLTGCREAAWSKCPYGYAMGATGLYIRSIDIARLGSIYAHDGMWKDTRIISKEWVDLAKERHYEFARRDNGAYTKGGMRGQMVYFNPATGLSAGWLACEGSGGCGRILAAVMEYDQAKN